MPYIEINDLPYRHSHGGKPPRGKGPFRFAPFAVHTRYDVNDYIVVSPPDLSYADARTWLRKQLTTSRKLATKSPWCDSLVWAVLP